MNNQIYSNNKHCFSKYKDLILLLQPPVTVNQEDIATFGTFPPLGLAYIAAALEREDFRVEIADLLAEKVKHIETLKDGKVKLGMPEEQIIDLLNHKHPHVVGISNNFTSFSHDALRLAQIVGDTLPDALIVMGGAHASMEKSLILKSGNVDVVVIGEGEITFIELVKALCLDNPKGAMTVAGTAWNVGGEVIINEYREPVSNLDELPMPAYHLLPMQKYIWQRHANFAFAMRYPIGHMITSRGCINNCIFCSTTKHFKRFRKRSVENVIEEIKFLINQYGIREFHFHDDSFTADINRVRLLCERIIEERLDIKWQVSQGINSNRLDFELLRLMEESGMYRVGFPIETGSTEMLRYIRKPINLDRVKSLIEDCNKLGIYCFGCFMIGFPHERMEHIQQTIDFIMDSGLDYVKVSITQPLAGSELYEEYKRLGLLNESAHSSTYFHTQYDTVHLKAGDLNTIRQNITNLYSKESFKRLLSIKGLRRFILPKLRNLEDIRYFIKVGFLALRGQ